MELQWPLILFTTLVAWSAGVFGTQAVLALRGEAPKAQLSCWITAAGRPAASRCSSIWSTSNASSTASDI